MDIKSKADYEYSNSTVVGCLDLFVNTSDTSITTSLVFDELESFKSQLQAVIDDINDLMDYKECLDKSVKA